MRQKWFDTSCQFDLLSKSSIKTFQWSCKGIVMLHRGFCTFAYLFQMHIPLSLDEMTPHQYEISITEANHESEILTRKFIFLKKNTFWIIAPTGKIITFLYSSSLRIEHFYRKQTTVIHFLVDMLEVTLNINVWFTSFTNFISGQTAAP